MHAWQALHVGTARHTHCWSCNWGPLTHRGIGDPSGADRAPLAVELSLHSVHPGADGQYDASGVKTQHQLAVAKDGDAASENAAGVPISGCLLPGKLTGGLTGWRRRRWRRGGREGRGRCSAQRKGGVAGMRRGEGVF